MNEYVTQGNASHKLRYSENPKDSPAGRTPMTMKPPTHAAFVILLWFLLSGRRTLSERDPSNLPKPFVGACRTTATASTTGILQLSEDRAFREESIDHCS